MRKSRPRPQQRRLAHLRDQVRLARLTIHTRLLRVNIPADLDLSTLSDQLRAHLRELAGAGYQLQLYIPSANPRQDQLSHQLTGPRCLRGGL